MALINFSYSCELEFGPLKISEDLPIISLGLYPDKVVNEGFEYTILGNFPSFNSASVMIIESFVWVITVSKPFGVKFLELQKLELPLGSGPILIMTMLLISNV